MSEAHEEQVPSYIPSQEAASAPPMTEENNGFEQIEQTEIENAVDTVLEQLTDNVKVAEVAAAAPVAEKKEEKKPELPEKANEAGKKGDICAACPYSFLGGSCFAKMLSCSNLPPNVQDLVLWKCPKYTGAVFGTSLVLLLSMSSCSLLTVFSTLILLAMTICGAYRLYLSIVFRIKGTYDETFDKASAYDLSLPKDKIQEFAQLIDTDMNQSLNKLKSIVLWDNVCTSVMAFVALYFVYCIGSIFNTMTLLIIGLVKIFTIPKVYQLYKVQIDQGLQKAADGAHQLARQIEAKIPASAMQFLHKFKKD